MEFALDVHMTCILLLWITANAWWWKKHPVAVKVATCKYFIFICKYCSRDVWSWQKVGSVTETAVKAITCLPEPSKRGLAHLRENSNEGKSVIFQCFRADTDGAPSMNNPGMSSVVLSQILYQLKLSQGHLLAAQRCTVILPMFIEWLVKWGYSKTWKDISRTGVVH